MPGFIGNRLQHALKREAIALVANGVCDAETLDKVVTEGFGSRLGVLGPLEQSDMVGLSLTLDAHRVLISDLDRTPGPHPLLEAKVAAGNDRHGGRRGLPPLDAGTGRCRAQALPGASRQRSAQAARGAQDEGAGVMALDRDTLAMLIDGVRRFVENECVPLEREIAEQDEVPESLIAQMRELGLFGFAIPQEYGGLGLDMEEEVLLVFELSKTSPAIRSVVGTNNGIGAQALVLAGTEEQKQRYLPRLAAGEIISSFALTEPEAGSDAASLRTSAADDGDGFILNGTKRFITNGPHADLFTVFARSEYGKSGADGISAFLVEAPRAGLTRGKPERKMGQQGAHVCDIVFENCRVDSASAAWRRSRAGVSEPRCRCWIAAGCIFPRSASASPNG